MTFPLTPQQFSSLLNKLANTKGVVLRPANQLSGVLSTSQATLAYSYDRTAALTVDVTELHGLAKLASPEKVQDHIAALLKESLS